MNWITNNHEAAKPIDHDDLCKRLRGSADFLDKAGFTGFPLIAKDCREAATEIIGLHKSAGHELNKELRAENAALREQVEAFRREQIARSKIDPVTRLHNLCDHLAEQRRESPFTAESLELADASYKELCADNAALRRERDAVSLSSNAYKCELEGAKQRIKDLERDYGKGVNPGTARPTGEF